MYQVFQDKDCTIVYTEDKVDGKRIGIVQSGTALYEEETLDAAEKQAKAWLIDNNLETVYLCDSGKVLKFLRNTGVDEWTDKYYKYSAIYIAHIVFLATYIVGTATYSPGSIGVVSLAGIIILYHLFLRAKLAEIESAALCELALIVALWLISIIQSANHVVN